MNIDSVAGIEILKKLAAKMPEEAIQRTKKSETKKGYDTDGYGYQYCVDRFNDVLGLYWGHSWQIESHIEGQYKSGQTFHEITVSAEIWIVEKSFSRGCAGGHTSSNYSDALKGAITNAFKKAASFWGVGRDAYAGTIDDDNKPLPEPDSEKSIDLDKFYSEMKLKISAATEAKVLVALGEKIRSVQASVPDEMISELRGMFSEKMKEITHV
jgi:hypothetical protein